MASSRGEAYVAPAEVTLSFAARPRWSELAERAAAVGREPGAALGLALELGDLIPLPGAGETLARWSALATLGAVDLVVARALEPHLDALAILAEADPTGVVPERSTWGVFAAEGPGVRLEASRTGSLTGIKPWCSLAGILSHALVTAWVSEQERGLFAVDLRQQGVSAVDDPWVPHGLRPVRSTPVRFDDVPAVEVGGPSWYLRRDGFAWGGIGVAAVWFGGAVGVLRRMQAQAAERTLDQIGRMHLGAADAALSAARALLAESAAAIDAGVATGEAGAVWAHRVRASVHDAAELTLRAADHALGPAPLTREEEYADRLADLRVYLRQHHAERDLAALGSSTAPGAW